MIVLPVFFFFFWCSLGLLKPTDGVESAEWLDLLVIWMYPPELH